MKPSHANDNLKDDLIQRTRQLWQPRLVRAAKPNVGGNL